MRAPPSVRPGSDRKIITTMTIHEQIIAFLDGELGSEAEASELMHVLAVSPEKRNILIESARMQRAFGTMGSTLTPATAIDQAILAGIVGIDAGLPAANASHSADLSPSEVANSRTRRWGLVGLAAFLLLSLGYLIGQDQSSVATLSGAMPAAASSNAASSNAASSNTTRSTVTTPNAVASNTTASTSATLQATSSTASSSASDSLAALRAKVLSLQDALAARPVRTIVRYLRGSATTDIKPVAEDRARAMNQSERATVSKVAVEQSSPLPSSSATLSRESTLLRSSTRGASKIPVAEASSTESTERRWHVGIRNNIRTSLPKIYGLATRQNILTDREIQGGVRFDEGFLGLRTPVGVGAAFGGTRFSQIFQVREGGASVNTVIEQTPNLLYARAWLAPQILSSQAWSGSLELGGGGTEVGPFLSLGLDAEWRPIDLVSVHGGASSWLMWSGAQLQTSLSSNINGYMGVSYWF